MGNEVGNPAFDAEEQAILSNIVPETEAVEEVNTDQPAAETPAPAAATQTQAETPAATEPAAAATTTEQNAAPQGDTRAALRASRRAEKRLRDELDAIRAENEALKQGKPAPNADTSITDTELAELEADFPLQAKIVRRQRELEAQLAKDAGPGAQTPEFEPLTYDPAVQEVIDGVPDLVAWQYDPAAQDKFARAIEYDKALAVDPDWKDKGVTERFAEAARRTKAALTGTPSAAPAANRNDPATVIANAPATGPKGISDFRGGAPANAPEVDYSRMSDEQILSSLPVT